METLWLTKKRRYFNYKEKAYIIFNCPEKAKISAIIDILNIYDIENIDQGKE